MCLLDRFPALSGNSLKQMSGCFNNKSNITEITNKISLMFVHNEHCSNFMTKMLLGNYDVT